MNIDPLYRTFWRRFWAGYVDTLVFVPAMALDYWVQYNASSAGVRAAWFVFGWALFPAYQIYMHGRYGQTVGKRLLGLKVVDVSGSPLTMGQAFRREALNLPFTVWSLAAWVVFILHGGNPYDRPSPPAYAPPAMLPFALFALELLSTLGNRRRRALHDFVASSVVIRYRAAGGSSPETGANAPVPREPISWDFTCPACGTPLRFGASHCHVCDQPFLSGGRSTTRQLRAGREIPERS